MEGSAETRVLTDRNRDLFLTLYLLYALHHMSDDGSSVELEPYETQFVPKENDDNELWDVIAIVAERPQQFKVKWKGIDPATRKPWKDSWVSKEDCTDDLIREWKVKQAKKKAGKLGTFAHMKATVALLTAHRYNQGTRFNHIFSDQQGRCESGHRQDASDASIRYQGLHFIYCY